MNKRFLAVTAVAATTALVASACSSGGDQSSSSSGGGGSASGGGEAVTLVFQSLSDQPAAIAATEDIVDQWNADHPDIQVKIQPVGWDGVYDKLITQFNGGAAPDIIHYEAASIVSFAQDGYLADLTDLMPSDFANDLPEGLLDTVTVDGQVIAYPTEMQTYTIFANKTLLDQAGVEIPTGDTVTWDQIRQIAKATTKDGVYGLAWGLKSPTATFMTMGPQFGGTYFEGSGADATISIGEGELALPQLVHDMADEDGSIMPVTLTQSGSEALAAWYDGQAALTVQGSFQAANIAADAPEGFDWVVLPPVEGPEGPSVAANPQTLSINIDSPHVEEAAQFLDFFTSADNLAALNKADALIPATLSAQKKLADELGTTDGWDKILASGQYMGSAPYLSVDKYAQWKDTVATPAFQKYLADQTDLTGLQEELATGWDTLDQ